MSTHPETELLDLLPEDNHRLANLAGPFGRNLRLIEARVGVEINERGHRLAVIGPADFVSSAVVLLKDLYTLARDGEVTPETIHLHLQQSGFDELGDDATDESESLLVTPKRKVTGRGPNQRRYIRRIQTHDLNFGIGPAGTGKTYLAVACAVDSLMRDEVRRILLVRPAVEAGERLGFLPGDLAQKIDPYLR
ncbi:MAG: PhoH family protein, partial [Gammaproteobacteria bacterium]|nr:PhoH family protein [Gammaproteobacteria bacterium]